MKKGVSIGVIRNFYEGLFADLANSYSSYEVWKFDRDYLLSRLEKEGCAFALQSLPKLGKAIEVALVRMEPLVVPLGFTIQKSTGFPRFLVEFISKLFEERSLSPIVAKTASYGSSRALWHWREHSFSVLRQLLMAFSKTVVESAEDTKVYQEFIQRVTAAPNIDASQYSHAIIKEARCLLRGRFPNEETLAQRWPFWKKYLEEPFGRHGPGAVAGGEYGRVYPTSHCSAEY